MTNIELDKVLRRIRNAKVHANKILQSPNSTPDEKEDAQDLLCQVDELVRAMCAYTESVFDDERKKKNQVQLVKNANSVVEYQSMAQDIERLRGIQHDALLVDVKMADLYCRMHGIEEVCGLLPEEYKNDVGGLLKDPNTGVLLDKNNPIVPIIRHKIADWCWEVVLGSTVEMYMEIDDYNKSFSETAEIGEIYNKKIGGTRGAKKMIDELTSLEK